MKEDRKSGDKSSLKDHKKLLRSRGGEMETVNDKTTNDDNLDLLNFPEEKLKVIVELDHDNLRVSCEGPCDLDKWRKAYVTHWRRKLNNSQWKIETNNSFDRFLQV